MLQYLLQFNAVQKFLTILLNRFTYFIKKYHESIDSMIIYVEKVKDKH